MRRDAVIVVRLFEMKELIRQNGVGRQSGGEEMVRFQNWLDPHSLEVVRDRHGPAVQYGDAEGHLPIRTCVISRSLSRR